MKELKKYDVSEKIFEDILVSFPKSIIKTDNIKDYFCGYKDKWKMMYDGKEYIICQEYILSPYTKVGLSDWKQVIIRKSKQTSNFEQSVTGLRAWNYMYALLKKYYSVEEIEECFNTHQSEYNENQIQVHILPEDSEKILRFDNCYKYDINSAHGDALREIFPKASKAIEDMFLKRKEKPIYKAYMNYFVGFMCKKNHRKTYNWVVQRTTRKLNIAMTQVDGEIIYANTDGFIVKNPRNLLNASKELGEFKLEYQGTVYSYTDKNYYCIQTDDIVGNVSCGVRDDIDLSQGKVVHYRRILDTNLGIYKVVDVTKEIISNEER